MKQINGCGERAAARYENLVYWSYNWRKAGGSQRMVEISKRALNQGPNEAKSFMKQLIGDDLYKAFVATKFGEPEVEPKTDADKDEEREDFSWGSY